MLLQAKKLTKSYPDGVLALHDINFSIPGGLIGVIGPNAAGKTTLLKVLAGLEDPTAGAAMVGGVASDKNKAALRSGLGYLPQEFDFYKNITGEDMLEYIAVLKGVGDGRLRRVAVDEAIAAVNLGDVRRTRIREYSFGMKKRLGVAQAILGDPKVLILDEPMEGLDPGEAMNIGGLLTRIAQRRPVVMSTHSLGNIEVGCGTLLLLRRGELLFTGSPAELAAFANGMVWTVEVSYTGLEHLKQKYRLVGVHPKEGNMVARVLSPGRPTGHAVPVTARLEEGYLALMDAEV